ncbi:MAG: flagellar protein FlgN [Roseovarius sp.]|uniref:flagellar protein FlgN n=1 Tax=Roseovarius sp. TaxID=1486281 RepID=UPI0032EC11AF
MIAQLDALLETERAALLCGDLQAIADTVAQKEQLIDTLNTSAARQEDLSGLHHKLQRNQALLDGALQGIRAVAARMAAYRRIRKSLDTYDRQGRKLTIPGDISRNVEKRA